MTKLKESKQFEKDKKSILRTKAGESINLELAVAIGHIISREPIPENYLDHALKGKEWKGTRELHVRGDILLIYRIKKEVLELVRIGTHSELF